MKEWGKRHKNEKSRDFPGVQRLRLQASTAGGMGSIPGQGTKIPHAAKHGPKKPQKKNKQKKREREKSKQELLKDKMKKRKKSKYSKIYWLRFNKRCALTCICVCNIYVYICIYRHAIYA